MLIALASTTPNGNLSPVAILFPARCLEILPCGVFCCIIRNADTVFLLAPWLIFSYSVNINRDWRLSLRKLRIFAGFLLARGIHSGKWERGTWVKIGGSVQRRLDLRWEDTGLFTTISSEFYLPHQFLGRRMGWHSTNGTRGPSGSVGKSPLFPPGATWILHPAGTLQPIRHIRSSGQCMRRQNNCLGARRLASFI